MNVYFVKYCCIIIEGGKYKGAGKWIVIYMRFEMD